MPRITVALAGGFSESWDAALYRVLLENPSSWALVVDRSLRIVATTQSVLDSTGRTAESMIGNSLDTVFPCEALAGVTLASRVEEVFKAGVSDVRGPARDCTTGAPTRTDSYQVLPLQAQGSVECALILRKDMSERVSLMWQARIVQAHLASLAEQTSDFVLLIDCDGHIATWNSAAECILGLSIRDRQNYSMCDLCTDVDGEVLRALLQRVTQESRAHSAKLNVKSSSRNIIPMVWTVVPLRPNFDEMVGLMAIGRDPTAQRTFEACREQNARLVAQGTITRELAHELRAPLAVSSSAAQFLQTNHLTPTFRAECVQHLRDGLERITIIVENMLNRHNGG